MKLNKKLKKITKPPTAFKIKCTGPHIPDGVEGEYYKKGIKR